MIDFGSRRAHGTDAVLKVARATYLAGGHGTSNVLAGKLYGIPVFGTMAHSYIQAHDSEYQAFEAFVSSFPETTLLVDTYDTLDGVRNVVRLSRQCSHRFRVKAIRLDSGDLGSLAIEARKILDEAGLQCVKIFASSGLDEYKIQSLVESGAPIHGFGVGTSLAVSEDAPALDMAYKLVEYVGKGRLKLSTAKVVYPGRKQVFRQYESGKHATECDRTFRRDDLGNALLEAVFRGRRRSLSSTLDEARHRLQSERDQLPHQLLELKRPEPCYPVAYSNRLQCDLALLRSIVSTLHPVRF